MLKNIIFKLLHGISYYFRYKSLLHHPSRQNMMPSFVIPFTGQEQVFLEQAAQSINYVIDYSLGYRQRDQFLLQLEYVTFLGNSGAVVVDGNIVVESVFEVSRLGKSTAFKTPALLIPEAKKGLYTSVLHLPLAKDSNFHWFFDCLPRLYFMLKQIKEPLKIIMRKDLPYYQHQTLQYLLQDSLNAEVVYIGAHDKWEVERFVLPSFVANTQSAFLPLELSKWLQQKIWGGYQVKASNARSRIYISRSKAKKRRVLNEEKYVPLLRAHHVEIVWPEELTYQQQVQLFYNAEIVIAPHGAGLTNLLFSRSCKVLEMHPSNLIKTHYMLLCKGLGFNYTPLVGTEGDMTENYSVDPAEIERWLDKPY